MSNKFQRIRTVMYSKQLYSGRLVDRRDDLEKMTETAMGSFKNWIPAISFYHDAVVATSDAKVICSSSCP